MSSESCTSIHSGSSSILGTTSGCRAISGPPAAAAAIAAATGSLEVTGRRPPFLLKRQRIVRPRLRITFGLGEVLYVMVPSAVVIRHSSTQSRRRRCSARRSHILQALLRCVVDMVRSCIFAVVAASQSLGPWPIAVVLLGLGTALDYPALLAAIGDVAHPTWRACFVGIYRLCATAASPSEHSYRAFSQTCMGFPQPSPPWLHSPLPPAW